MFLEKSLVVLEKRLMFLEIVWCFWIEILGVFGKKFGVFGNSLVVLEIVWCFWKKFSVFGKSLVVLEKFGVLGDSKKTKRLSLLGV